MREADECMENKHYASISETLRWEAELSYTSMEITSVIWSFYVLYFHINLAKKK